MRDMTYIQLFALQFIFSRFLMDDGWNRTYIATLQSAIKESLVLQFV